jgi:hypothetical protein
MRAPSADSSARWRSWIGSILGLAVDVCFGTGRRLLTLRDRLDPAAAPVLTKDRADRIFGNVMIQIAAEPPVVPPFNLATFLATRPTVICRWTERH